MKNKRIILPATVLLTLVFMSMNLISDKEDQHKPYSYFEDPLDCSGCHWDRYDRFSTSQHSKAFTGDFFQKQFYDFVLPSLELDDKLKGAAEDCIGCHSPSAFLAGDMVPKRMKGTDNHWNRTLDGKNQAERGVFCDFCHTLDRFEHVQPFNHDYVSHATNEVDPKRASLEYAWSPYHKSETYEIFENVEMCATCHNELNPYDVWVKATEHEYLESVYPARGITCQNCHMQPMGGKPAKMGFIRVENHDHWFGGGFAEFVEGAAGVYIQNDFDGMKKGQEFDFDIMVKALATGHYFPTGSTEERDVWLHVSLQNESGQEVMHIPVNKNSDDPNDQYFITSNEKVAYPSHSSISDPICRDALTEGDRIYHSIFLDNAGQVTFGQWLTTKEIENRLRPLEERMESFTLKIPDDIIPGDYTLVAELYYKRMPDSYADFLGIDRRPAIQVSRDVRVLTVH